MNGAVLATSSAAPDAAVASAQPSLAAVPGIGLRAWQIAAIRKYEATNPQDFMATATPGAGKTTFALTLASRLKQRRVIDRIIVVAPTDHLRTQWADAAARMSLALDPNLPNSVGPVRPGADGYVTTYAQVAGHPLLHQRRTEAKRTLVIMDEIHHAGDALSWGEAVFEAFTPAARRLGLTGTPFRTKSDERIPFVRYVETAADEFISEADYTYGYRDALNDGVVRPVFFAAYSGTSRWMNSAGDTLSASLSDPNTRKDEEAAWRTALDPSGQWVPHVIAAIDDRITHLRATGMPDAAGLILASDQDTAREYAKLVKKITGEAPLVILSDDPKASKKISQFETGTQRMAVCVRMVSEGVDIPRAAALGFLTSYRTALFFAQAVGRVVRARGPHETATVFLPAVRPLLALAAELETERNHIIKIVSKPEDGLDELVVERVASEPGGPEFEALGAEAEFAHVLHSGRAIVASVAPEDQDFIGLPGLLSPEQTAALLASRDGAAKKRAQEAGMQSDLFADEAEPAAEVTQIPQTWREVEDLRKGLSKLVSALAARTGRKHAEIHIEVRKAVPGPPSASASIQTLMARRDYLLARLH